MSDGGQPQAVVITSHGPDATRCLGAALGALAEAGDVLLLQGDLGAGKTTFTQGYAAGAGSTELVNSPTFVLVNQYAGRLPIYHADLYRLDDPEEVAALDLAHGTLDGALLVEWPERGAGQLPADHLLVRIEHDDADRRRIEMVAHGERASELLAAFQAARDGAAWS
jgi:tRNA threonylcarbamoyladenosine biosynthesis protein TsaE